VPSGRDSPARIASRASAAGLDVDPELVTRLAAYLDLLSRWNRKINLTGFDLEPASDEAIDRLIVEPLFAARYVEPGERRAIDIGSGGGSPAIPLKIACPQLQFVLVEAKARKAAFLREAVRALELNEVDVEEGRLEDVARSGRRGAWADLATIRAVRVDAALMAAIASVSAPRGRMFLFGSSAQAIGDGAGSAETLPIGTGGVLRIVSARL
jgi:16S rRNA (guanine(527)-N(7))-methyltransferase GidB